ncbi:MAG: hypothetical protein ACLQKA_05475 [Bryobacteraceae bacterium]
MRRVLCVPMCLMAGWLAIAADQPARSNQDAVPPDDVIVVLPGPPPGAPEAAKPKSAAGSAPAPKPNGGASSAGGASRISTKAAFPPAFELNSAFFCQSMIGQWTTDDARYLLGEPKRERPAYGDNQIVNGRIYAFPDPTGRYRELELDFESGSGLLRTVFVYPQNMTWQECRRLWGGGVSATDAEKGRKFYSYLDRRLDVLVDSAGKVISLGLY